MSFYKLSLHFTCRFLKIENYIFIIRQLKVIRYVQTQVSEQQFVNYISRKSLNRAGRRAVRRGRSRSRVEDIGSPAIAAPSDAP